VRAHEEKRRHLEMADARADLIDALAKQIGVPPLTPPEVEAVLLLAAAAAHGTGDRTSAPLVSFLAGITAAASTDRETTLEDIRRRVAELAPEAQTG
jgi:hypothetical protein